MPLRIGMVSQSYYPVMGGVSEHVHFLSRELLHRGHEVTIVTGSEPSRVSNQLEATRSMTADLLEAGGQIARVGRLFRLRSNGGTASLVGGASLLRDLRELSADQFDILHVHSPFEPFLPMIALQHFRCPKVGTFHSFGRHRRGYRLFRRLLHSVASRLDLRTAVSPAARDYVRGLFPGDYEIVPNGIDLDRFSPTVSGAIGTFDEAFERRYRRSTIPVRLLVVGRLDPRKGHRTLFEAIDLIRRRTLPAFELVVLGEGPLRASLERVVHEEGLPITFLGACSPTELAKEYARADVAIAPATHGESFGVVLLEAMASGLPLVVSDIRGYRDVVLASGAARLFESGNPRALASRLEELIRDPREREALGRSGRLHVARYCWKRVATEVERLYDSLIPVDRSIPDQSMFQVSPVLSNVCRSPAPR